MRTIAWVVALWWAGHGVLIGLSVLEVFLYASLVAPGLAHTAYEAHASVSAPWVALIGSAPVFFAWGRVLRSRVPPVHVVGAAVAVWGLYTATDAAIVTAGGAWTAGFAVLWSACQAAKALGLGLGIRARAGRAVSG